jgi:hypothetical protein
MGSPEPLAIPVLIIICHTAEHAEPSKKKEYPRVVAKVIRDANQHGHIFTFGSFRG